MAVTKIKPIRGTVNKAIAYILDPQKTDDAFYVSSYGCAASDAAAKEFEWTRNLAVQQGMQMPKVLARHLIQSFDIGEVTPEEAHEVGKQLADEWLKGKYEYVIATHIDKGHCHNHIISRYSRYRWGIHSILREYNRRDRPCTDFSCPCSPACTPVAAWSPCHTLPRYYNTVPVKPQTI